MTLPEKSISALVVAVVLALAPAVSARILPLSRSYASGAVTQYTYRPGVAPAEGGSLGFTARPAHPRWYRVTVAYQTTWGYVLVGCRGHGSAKVTIWLRGARAGAVTGDCVDHERWLAFFLGVEPSAHVMDSIRMTAEADPL